MHCLENCVNLRWRPNSADTEMQTQSTPRNPKSVALTSDRERAKGLAAGKRLLLFDIDGTLIHSGGAGIHALKSAFKERFGIDDDLQGIEIAGMTDSGIVVSILNKHEIPATNENVSTFLDSYVHFLSLELPRRKGKLLPGVLTLLERLKARPHLVLALLTGNVSRGAQLKLEHYAVWHFFEFGAFADDHHDRNRLGPFARARAKEKQHPRSTSLAILPAILTAERP
jgi:phosphoglycolate phosphatase-like HAD superfamily hydrolase